MDPQYWRDRWRDGLTGFHQDEINPHLLAHVVRLGLAPGDRVLVPLCGKSLDMLWLRERGFGVLGVEISEIAVKAFFTENGIDATLSRRGSFDSWLGERIEILCGDFFDLQPVDPGQLAAVYDRASLVALPEPLRRRYAAHLAGLLAPGVKVLLVTFEYPQHEMSGPPFSVDGQEVMALYGSGFDVECVAAVDVLQENERFRARGLTAITEKIYLLERRDSGTDTAAF